jgi:hypothetical protein
MSDVDRELKCASKPSHKVLSQSNSNFKDRRPHPVEYGSCKEQTRQGIDNYLKLPAKHAISATEISQTGCGPPIEFA